MIMLPDVGLKPDNNKLDSQKEIVGRKVMRSNLYKQTYGRGIESYWIDITYDSKGEGSILNRDLRPEVYAVTYNCKWLLI